MLRRGSRAGREKTDIDAAEIELGELLHAQVLATELHRLADRSLARERMKRGDREFALLQDLDHRLTDEAGGADHRDIKFFCHVYSLTY